MKRMAMTTRIKPPTLAMIAYVVVLSDRADVDAVEEIADDGKLRIVTMMSVEMFVDNTEHVCVTTTRS